MDPIPDHEHERAPSVSRARLVFIAFLGMAVFLLILEHRAHLYGALPYLILLACPLMHLFMHGGHGHRHGSGQQGCHGTHSPSSKDADQ